MANKKSYMYTIILNFLIVFLLSSCASNTKSKPTTMIKNTIVSTECQKQIDSLKLIFSKFEKNQITSDIKIDSVLCEYKFCIKNMTIDYFKQSFPSLNFSDSLIELTVLSTKSRQYYSSHSIIFESKKLVGINSGRAFIEGMSMRDHYSSIEEKEQNIQLFKEIYKNRFQKYLDCFNN